MTVSPLGKVELVIDFGETHAVDDQGDVFCVLGPGKLIPDGRRVLMGSVFRLYLGQQYEGGPVAICQMCRQRAAIGTVTRISEGPP